MADDAFDQAVPASTFFPALTEKQHEVLRLVAENRTSKEIAFELGISESAVNQRIESIRKRAGWPPRAELARAYRQYLHDLQRVRDAMLREDARISQRNVGAGEDSGGSLASADENGGGVRAVAAAVGLLLLAIAGFGTAWAVGLF